MKLFLISQSQNDGYDTYDSAVVAAPDEEAARRMHPADDPDLESTRMWCFPERVIVRYLGEAADDVEQCVVCASFNAG